MKITISWVGKVELKETKFGKKNKFSVKAVEEGDKFIDVWLKPEVPIWKVGDVQEVEGITPREYNGKTYYSVKLFGKNKDLEALKNEITALKLRVTALEQKDPNYPEFKGEPNFEPTEAPF